MPTPIIPSPSHPIAQDHGRLTTPWYTFLWQLRQAIDDASSSGAPGDADYIVGVPDSGLPNARVATDSATVTVDLTVPGIIRWHTTADAISELGYWTPISNGDSLSPEILFDAEGDVVVGFVPTPEAV